MRFAAFLIVALSSFGQEVAPAIQSIRKEELKADLFFLASDSMRGRLTNTPEYKIAGEWIASRLERLGLEPLEGETFVQTFHLVSARLGEGNRLLIGSQASLRSARLMEEFYPLNISANGEVKGRVALAGFGIQAPEHGWDDYQGRNVKGSLVMVFEGDPQEDSPESPFDGLVTSEHGGSLKKALVAQNQGAVALLIVSARRDAEGPRSFPSAARTHWPQNPRIERYQLASNIEKVRIPVIQISPALAEHILGSDIELLRKQADRAGGAVFSMSSLPVELATSITRTVISDRNIVAKIEGADPKLKEEAILISAHYDHDGADGERVMNGADDNGSGTVGLLEIAEAYATAMSQNRRPKRTVIFAFWGSEERGLLGSWAWVQNPLWPLEKTVAVLNMDMIGRNEEVPEGGGRRFRGLKPQDAAANANSVHLMGYSFNPELAEMVRQANREIDLTLRMEYDNNRSNLVRRSDQWPFLQNRVPSVFFHTGLHPDYHTPGDRPERINYPKMERIVRLVYQTSWDLATSDKRPKMPAKRSLSD